ncbi:MAG TPA: hypothetical protein PKA09_16985 [Geminicoccus sp.]|nr:hypothetical protein [Geminicoccus sp.]
MAIKTNSAQGTVESWEHRIEVHWNAHNMIDKLALEAAARGDALEAARCERIAELIAEQAHAIEDAPPEVPVCSDADARYLLGVLKRSTAPGADDREPWIRTLAAAIVVPLEGWLEARQVAALPAG